MSLTVRLLGEPHVDVQGERTELSPHRPVFLLAYLAYAGDWVRREELLGVFWPDESEARARRSLRVLANCAKAPVWARGLESEPLRLRWRVDSDVRVGFDCRPPGGCSSLTRADAASAQGQVSLGDLGDLATTIRDLKAGVFADVLLSVDIPFASLDLFRFRDGYEMTFDLASL